MKRGGHSSTSNFGACFNRPPGPLPPGASHHRAAGGVGGASGAVPMREIEGVQDLEGCLRGTRQQLSIELPREECLTGTQHALGVNGNAPLMPQWGVG